MTNIKDIYFIHIPKTAGTSLEDIFYNNGGCIGTCYFNKHKYNNSIVKNRKYKYISLHHIPLQFIKESFVTNIIDNYTIFCVVRNPYERIISDFKFWIEFHNQRKGKQNLKKNEYFLLKQIKKLYQNDYNINPQNLNKFIKNILNHKDLYTLLDGHFIPMMEYILIKKNNTLSVLPQNILKMENLNKDFNNFIKQYNLNIPLNIINKKKHNITSTKLSIKDLDKQSLNLINNIYANDFKFLKYKLLE